MASPIFKIVEKSRKNGDNYETSRAEAIAIVIVVTIFLGFIGAMVLFS